MKSSLLIATIAIICATGHPIAKTVDMPLARRASNFDLTVVGQNTANGWDGKWQGTTVSGHQLVLQLQVQEQRMTGRLTVGKQSANIVEGKALRDAFALVTGPIDGHRVDATGRRVGETIELTIEGAKEPLTLTRMQ
jgi:hypothetical protein